MFCFSWTGESLDLVKAETFENYAERLSIVFIWLEKYLSFPRCLKSSGPMLEINLEDEKEKAVLKNGKFPHDFGERFGDVIKYSLSETVGFQRKISLKNFISSMDWNFSSPFAQSKQYFAFNVGWAWVIFNFFTMTLSSRRFDFWSIEPHNSHLEIIFLEKKFSRSPGIALFTNFLLASFSNNRNYDAVSCESWGSIYLKANFSDLGFTVKK